MRFTVSGACQADTAERWPARLELQRVAHRPDVARADNRYYLRPAPHANSRPCTALPDQGRCQLASSAPWRSEWSAIHEIGKGNADCGLTARPWARRPTERSCTSSPHHGSFANACPRRPAGGRKNRRLREHSSDFAAREVEAGQPPCPALPCLGNQAITAWTVAAISSPAAAAGFSAGSWWLVRFVLLSPRFKRIYDVLVPELLDFSALWRHNVIDSQWECAPGRSSADSYTHRFVVMAPKCRSVVIPSCRGLSGVNAFAGLLEDTAQFWRQNREKLKNHGTLDRPPQLGRDVQLWRYNTLGFSSPSAFGSLRYGMMVSERYSTGATSQRCLALWRYNVVVPSRYHATVLWG
jgi:hypothetical protein